MIRSGSRAATPWKKLLWRRRWSLVGPLFYYDLARLAQRNRTIQLRCLYLVVVALALGALSFGQGGTVSADLLGHPVFSSSQKAASIAPASVQLILLLQMVALLILTPAYLASAFTEDKERKTIQFFFVTDLRNHELVLGRLLGRLTLLGTILLVGLPFIALYTSWGPVDHLLVFFGVAAALLAMLSTGSISILCSILCPNTLVAVVSSYALVIGLNFSCLTIPALSPLLFVTHGEARVERAWKNWDDEVAATRQLYQVSFRPGATRGVASAGVSMPLKVPKPDPLAIRLGVFVPFVIMHGSIFIICAAVSILSVRAACLAPGPAGQMPLEPSLPMSLPRATPTNPGWEWENHSNFTLRPTLKVQEPALRWKELEFGVARFPAPSCAGMSRLKPTAAALVLLIALYFAMTCYVRSGYPKEKMLRFDFDGAQIVGFTTACCMGLWTLIVAFRTASSITVEREQDTLQGLLMLPGERHEILHAKWFGGIQRFGMLGYVLRAIWLIGLATGALHPASLVLLATGCAVYLAFVATLGLWISLVSRSTLWANLTMALALMLCFLGSMVKQVAGTPEYGWRNNRWISKLPNSLLNPGSALISSAFPRHTWHEWYGQKTGDSQRAATGVRVTQKTKKIDNDIQELRRELAMIPLNLAFFGLLAILFWWLARWQFRKAYC